MNEEWDVIVVGAGIIGSCTAYHAQKLGLKTLLLEQFTFGHKNGSSHGQSRIIRYAHTDAPYIPVVDDSYKQIHELEKKRNEKLWNKTGLMWFGSVHEVHDIAQILNGYNLENEVLDHTQISKKFPQFSYDSSWNALYDPMGGVLYADKWLHAFQDEFRKFGGVALENEKAILYQSTGNGVTLRTENGVFRAKKVVFTVGTWLQKLFPELNAGVMPEAIAVTYWRPKKTEDIPLFKEDKFPVFIVERQDTNDLLYGLPSVDYPDAIKFCNHNGDEYHIQSPVETVRQINIDLPARHLAKHVPKLEASKPAYVDKCKYTMSSDRHYVIDHHPSHHNVLIGGCMSGTGFKVAPAVGRALAHMAANKKTPFDVSFFSLSRFNKSKL